MILLLSAGFPMQMSSMLRHTDMASQHAQPPAFKWSWDRIKKLLAETYRGWNEVEAPRMGASLAYYTVLSLAPLLIVVIAIASFAFGEQAARGALVGQVQSLVGTEGAQAVQGILQHAAEKKTTGIMASIIGILALLFGASSVTLELRSSINKIWAAPEAEGVAGFIKQRSYAVGIVLGAGFLLLVSLVVSATLATFGKFFGGLPFPEWVAHTVNELISLVVIAGIFAAIFKFLPSVHLRWNDVWIGAVFTAVLFTIGKTLIGLYLGKASIGSSYGAAGSLVLILVWIYYSAQIFFLGAEFTKVYANDYGSQVGKRSASQGAPKDQVSIDPVESAPVEALPHRSFVENVAMLAASAAGLTMATINVFRTPRSKD